MSGDTPPYGRVSNDTPLQPSPLTPKPRGWGSVKNRASLIARIVAAVTVFVLMGATIGYFLAVSRQTATLKTPSVQTLSQNEINQLGETAAKLGTSGQTLAIAPNTEFKARVAVASDLLVGGRLDSTGPASLASLSVAGTTATTSLNVSSNLIVNGSATLQKALTVAGLTTTSSLNVSGNANVGSLNATGIIVRTISASGPVTISHLASQGPTPAIAAIAAGSGSNVAISGNDAAGTITINTGNGPGTTLATVTFRTPYSGSVHVLLTPRSSDAAAVGAYITSTSATFQVNARTALNGLSLSFDYLVIQ